MWSGCKSQLLTQMKRLSHFLNIAPNITIRTGMLGQHKTIRYVWTLHQDTAAFDRLGFRSYLGLPVQSLYTGSSVGRGFSGNEPQKMATGSRADIIF